MGTTVSHFPPTPANYPVFSLTIRTQDKIKVVDANATVVNIIRANLQKHYGERSVLGAKIVEETAMQTNVVCARERRN
ncbi:hypothetical protein L596_028185 [Steinernema carpocapsae]|uniref:Uncharacterized protein n=1 Tax=Steinernema carpocapsae TaxID=34508 RepID=A0A4U5LXN7_STECR|nr:hypothetical protein L596_028185 [Steinernema carpocapsae]